MSEKEIAEKILDLIGGKENVQAFEHCSTRLRLILKDPKIYETNKKQIEEVETVKGSFYTAGQVQIILGTGHVVKIHNELVEIIGESSTSVSQEAYKNMNALQKGSRILGDIFIPIIPVLVATGLFMGLRGFILELNPNPNEQLVMLSQVLTDTVFIFLPALVTMNAMKKFGGNQIIGLVLGLMMVSPVLPDAWAVAAGTQEALEVTIFGITFDLIGYQGSILPALVLGIFGAKVELFFRKRIPEIIDFIITPFLVLLLGMIFGLFIIGPIMNVIEDIIIQSFVFFMGIPLGIGGFIIGFFWQILVITGLHHAFIGVEMGLLEETGQNPLNALMTFSIVAQGTAAIAVAHKTKIKANKTTYISSGSSAFFGITEPSIFAVNLPRIKPFLLACFAGGVGGAIASVTGLAATGMSLTVIPGALLYIDGQLILYLALHIVIIILTYLLVYFLWDEEEYQQKMLGVES